VPSFGVISVHWGGHETINKLASEMLVRVPFQSLLFQ